MRRLWKWMGSGVGGVAALIGGGTGWLFAAKPYAGAVPQIKVESTHEQISRGQYLANHVTVCIDCHSERDWSRFSAPPKPGTEGKGGDRFGHDFGFPGEFFAPNITPAGIGSWSDGEVIRAFTGGVSRDGRALFPVMPYLAYGKMCESDARAITAYIRTLTPRESTTPPRQLDFPMNLIVRLIPKAPEPQPCPDPKDHLAYGHYLVMVSACADCHTPHEHGKPIEDLAFAGGFAFGPMPGGGGTVRSANITPDMETGIGAWTRESFVARFKTYRKPEAIGPVQPGELKTVMPWSMYAGMTDDDLGAIFDYLHTLRPVQHAVEHWTP